MSKLFQRTDYEIIAECSEGFVQLFSIIIRCKPRFNLKTISSDCS